MKHAEAGGARGRDEEGNDEGHDDGGEVPRRTANSMHESVYELLRTAEVAFDQKAEALRDAAPTRRRRRRSTVEMDASWKGGCTADSRGQRAPSSMGVMSVPSSKEPSPTSELGASHSMQCLLEHSHDANLAECVLSLHTPSSESQRRDSCSANSDSSLLLAIFAL